MKTALLILLSLVTLAATVILWPTSDRESGVQAAEDASARGGAGRRRRDPSTPDDPADGIWLEGRVVDRYGESVAGAIVTIDSQPVREVECDTRGVFEFPGLAPGAHRVVARTSGGFAGPVHVIVTADVEPLELVVVPAATLVVQVDDAQTRDRVADAVVSVDVGARLHDTTDANGMVAFTAVPSGSHVVTVRAKDYVVARLSVPIAEGNGEAEVHISLAHGELVRGRVRDEQGQPIEGASVGVYASGSADSDAGVTTVADGSFELRAVATDLRLTAQAEGFAPKRTEPLTSADLGGELVIVLARGRQLAGVVRDPNGAAIPDAFVQAVVQGDSSSKWSVKSAADGGFLIEGLPPTRLSLVALHAIGVSAPVDVPEGAASVADLELVLSDRGWIRGRVVDTQGDPIANASVIASADVRGRLGGTLESQLRGTPEATTNEQGEFAIEGLSPGRYLLRARGSAAIDDDITTRRGTPAQTGTAELELVLEAGGGIRGRVLDETGAPLRRYQLRIDLARPRDVSDRNGEFALDGIGAGHHRLTIDAPGIAGIDVPDVVVSNEATTQLGDLQAAAGHAIAGQVLDHQGLPVPGARVVVGSQILLGPKGSAIPLGRGGEGGFDVASTDASGRFRITGVDGGVQSVVAEHESGRSAVREIDGDTTGLVLELERGASLNGVVTSPDGPVAGAVVELVDPAAPRARHVVSTGNDGTFAFDSVPAGKHRISARTADRIDAQLATSAEVELDAGVNARIELVLARGDATLEIGFAPARRGPGRQALVLVVEGQISAHDAGGLERALVGVTGSAATAVSLEGDTVTVERLTAGMYSACITWIEVDPEDFAQLRRVQLEAATLPVSCQSVDAVAGKSTRIEAG